MPTPVTGQDLLDYLLSDDDYSGVIHKFNTLTHEEKFEELAALYGGPVRDPLQIHADRFSEHCAVGTIAFTTASKQAKSKIADRTKEKCGPIDYEVVERHSAVCIVKPKTLSSDFRLPG